MTTRTLASKARRYRELQAMIKQYEAELEQVKRSLISELEAKDTDAIHVDIFTIRYTPYQQERLDTAALKHDLPDLTSRYMKRYEVHRFQVA